MHQIAILPSGCQVSNKRMVHATENHFFYTSTLAVYILNSQTYAIEKILSNNERSISSISMSPHDSGLLAIASMDGKLSLWKIWEEDVISKVNVPQNTKMLLQWNPFIPQILAAVSSEPNIKIFEWDVTKLTGAMIELFSVKNDTIKAIVARWNPHSVGLLAVGCSNSWVMLFDTKNRSQRIMQVKDRTATVVDLQWDRLSSAYMLVAYQTFISLWDADSLEEIHTFDKQGQPITAVCWLEWTAGNFISTNSKTGVLKVWNASQKQPLDSIRVSGQGITSISFSAGSKRAFIGCTDGSVSVYHMQKMQAEYSSSAGHTETIFDCQFSPTCADILATASYDGTIKLWNILNQRLEKTLFGAEDIIYGCDWSPCGKMIIACTVAGVLVIWDVDSGKELCRYMHHTKAVYCVAWNQLCPEMICSTSADCTVFVMDINIEELYEHQTSNAVTGSRRRGETKTGKFSESTLRLKFVHPAPVFGCAWSKTHRQYASTCCQNGQVFVFDCSGSCPTPVYILRGHTARAFNCTWSPIIPGMLATGSDDNSILIWELDLDSDVLPGRGPLESRHTRKLTGHSSFVRAINWNYEHEHLLISGSWDSTIKMWDVRSGVCVHTVFDHIADIYSVVSHPDRPFTYVSCSRDTTMRVWELDGVFTCIRMKTVWDGNFDKSIVPNRSVEIPPHGMPIDMNDFDNAICKFGSQDEFDEVSASKIHKSILQQQELQQDRLNQQESKVSSQPAPGRGERLVRMLFNTGSSSSSVTTAAGAVSSVRQRPTGQLTKSFLGTSSTQAMPLSQLLSGKKSGILNSALHEMSTSQASEAKDEDPPTMTYRSSKSEPLLSALACAEDKDSHNDLKTSTLWQPLHHDLVQLPPLVLAQKFQKIFNLFTGANGCVELWENVLTCLVAKENQSEQARASSCIIPSPKRAGGGVNLPRHQLSTTLSLGCTRPSHQRIVLHESEVLPKLRSDARKCEIPASKVIAASAATNNMKSEEQMKEAAMIYARCGDFTKYCNIHVDLGAWTTALSVAPCVSMDYWRELSARYAVHLMNVQSSEQCIPYLVGMGRDADAVDFYVKRGCLEDAMGVAKFSESRTDILPNYQWMSSTGGSAGVAGGGGGSKAASASRAKQSGWSSSSVRGDIKDEHTPANAAKKSERAADDARQLIKSVACFGAEKQLIAGKSILAAAQHVAIGDIAAAVAVLTSCDECDLAYAVALCFGLETEYLVVAMADKYARSATATFSCSGFNVQSKSDFELALDMLSTLKDGEIQMGLLLSKYCDSDESCLAHMTQRGLRLPKAWASRAHEEETIGNDADSVNCYIIGRHYVKAASLGISLLRRNIRDPLEMTASGKKLYKGLKYLRAVNLEDPLRSNFLCYMLWFGAHEAAELGLWETAWNMLRLLQDRSSQIGFPITVDEINCQSIFFKITAGDTSSLDMLNEHMANQHISNDISELLRTLRALIKDAGGVPRCSELETAAQHLHRASLGAKATAAAGSMSPGPAVPSVSVIQTVAGVEHAGFGKEASLSNGVWGANTMTIFRQMQRLGDALSLPSLSKIHNKRASHFLGQQLAITGGVAQGSNLPASNQQLKSLLSYVTAQRIKGAAVVLGKDGFLFLSANESLNWRRVNPFSPTLSGEFM